jgi:hypothetical protein
LAIDSVEILFAKTDFVGTVILFIQSTRWDEVSSDALSSRVSGESNVAYTVLTVVNFVFSTFSALNDVSDENESIITVAKTVLGVTIFKTGFFRKTLA